MGLGHWVYLVIGTHGAFLGSSFLSLAVQFMTMYALL